MWATTRLLVHVEGDTEETFVNRLLASHLHTYGFAKVSARKMGNARQRGGIRPWNTVKDGICKHLTHDAQCFATLLVDYYAMPATGSKAWPGRDQANQLAHANKAQTIERSLQQDIAQTHGPNVAQRFIPYVVMHEFEALLFSDCAALANALGETALTAAFAQIRNRAATPEHINDSPQTAPSKRIIHLVPQYQHQKPRLGTWAALEVGLPAMRRECPGFADWLHRLEQLPLLNPPP
jgi:hypothetical protein